MNEKKTAELLYAQRLILWAIGEKPMTRRQIGDALASPSRASSAT